MAKEFLRACELWTYRLGGRKAGGQKQSKPQAASPGSESAHLSVLPS
jgi:hypothetical protein